MPKQAKKFNDTILEKCKKFVWLVFFHRLSLWNCMISIFVLWRSTRVKVKFALEYNWVFNPIYKWPLFVSQTETFYVFLESDFLLKTWSTNIFENPSSSIFFTVMLNIEVGADWNNN